MEYAFFFKNYYTTADLVRYPGWGHSYGDHAQSQLLFSHLYLKRELRVSAKSNKKSSCDCDDGWVIVLSAEWYWLKNTFGKKREKYLRLSSGGDHCVGKYLSYAI